MSIELIPFPLTEGVFDITADFLANLYGMKKVRDTYSVIMPWLDKRNALQVPSNLE